MVEGIRGHDYTKPYSKMVDYLDGMDAGLFTASPPTTPTHRVPRRPRPEDAGAGRRARRRCPPVLRPRRAHRLRPGDDGPRRPSCCPRAGRGARDRPDQGPRDRPGPHGDLPHPAELHEQPEALRLDRRRHRRRRQRPPRRRHRGLGRRGCHRRAGRRPPRRPAPTTCASRSCPPSPPRPRSTSGVASPPPCWADHDTTTPGDPDDPARLPDPQLHLPGRRPGRAVRRRGRARPRPPTRSRVRHRPGDGPLLPAAHARPARAVHARVLHAARRAGPRDLRRCGSARSSPATPTATRRCWRRSSPRSTSCRTAGRSSASAPAGSSSSTTPSASSSAPSPTASRSSRRPSRSSCRCSRGERPTLDGKHYSVKEAINQPPPVGRIPVMIGGSGETQDAAAWSPSTPTSRTSPARPTRSPASSTPWPPTASAWVATAARSR